jgi:antitoxin component YwqK of YwqJK toxin-antitoxin module
MLMLTVEYTEGIHLSQVRDWRRFAAVFICATICLASLAFDSCSGRHERVTYYPNGQVRERWYERTVGPTRIEKDGPYEAFYPDGSRQTTGAFESGDSLGLWQEWYLSGWNKSVKSFLDHGRMRGRSVLWMPNGDTLEIRTFNDSGVLDGRHAAFWRDTGDLHEQGDYSNGQRHGIWTRWFHNGQIEFGREYDHGRAVGRWVEFGPDGRIATSAEFMRTLPAELSVEWMGALVDGVPVGTSFVYQRHDRHVDTIASDQRDYGELQKKGPDWIVPFRWRSPRFGSIERQRFDTLYIWKLHDVQ